MGNLEDSFKEIMNDFLLLVTIENRIEKTNDFAELVKSHNSEGLSADKINKILLEYIHLREAEGWGTEVVIDVYERIGGYCKTDDIIKLIHKHD